jgi:NADPH2:quinone reductase
LKAVVCESFGPPESLVLKDVDSPAMKAEHVKVRVACCSVNFPDALMIQGQHQYRFEPPFIPGGELSGFVAEVGANAKGLAAGDAVTCLSFQGGFAEEAVVPLARVHALPKGLDMAEACCLAGTYGTALHALVQRAKIQPQETLLVLGAAGGSGVAAVQVAKLLKARVIAAVGSEEKLAFARRHGADEAFNYSTSPLREVLRSIAGPRGVDVVYDPVGGEYAEPALRSLAWNGRYLVIGFASGTIPSFRANLPLLKGCAILGVFTGEFMQREPEESDANMRQLVEWFSRGELRPAVSAVVPLAQAGEALRRVIDRRALGKLVVAVRDPAPRPSAGH